MTITLTPLSTLLIGLVAGLGSSFLFNKITASLNRSSLHDKTALLTKDPMDNIKMDLDLLRLNQTLRRASEPKRRAISGTC